MKRVVAGPIDSDVFITLLRSFPGISIRKLAGIEEFISDMAENGPNKIYLLPLIWPHAHDQQWRLIEQSGCDTSTSVLLLPKSMKDADSFTRESLPLPDNFVIPDESDLFIQHLQFLMEESR